MCADPARARSPQGLRSILPRAVWICEGWYTVANHSRRMDSVGLLARTARMKTGQSRILNAIAALEKGDRRRAAALIRQELKEGPKSGERWGSVSKLAEKIGEIDLALEASYRHALTEPVTLNRVLAHCGALAQAGRSEDALAFLDRLPKAAQNHPAALHFRGTIASENGDFERAETLLRHSLAIAAGAPQAWFALTMIKTFAPGDPDFSRMAAIEPQIASVDPLTRARYYYGMGKALVDMGEVERGFDYYEKGAAIRRQDNPYDRDRQEAVTEGLINDFTPEGLAKLQPSHFNRQRALFVNGLPRSGTTLVESILVSHSKVDDGAEINLVQPAFIPTIDYSLRGALAYQGRTRESDPFGSLATDYHRMLAMRFRGQGLVVDKTLSQSTVMGLLMHAMPEARVLWLRRNPEDVALSAYRSFFTASVNWSWSMEDIAHQMKLEDRLYAHWSELFGERILTVPYEKLVAEPDEWIGKMLAHVGLEDERQVREFHKSKRKVRTASVKQVRAPISTGAVGKAAGFANQLAPFRNAYIG